MPKTLRVPLSYACPVSWESMAGDERVRLCGMCRKKVYNLSELTEDEARLLLDSRSAACATFYERADGTLVTAPCPTALGAARRRAADAAIRWVGATLAVAGLAVGGASATLSDDPGETERAVRALPVVGPALNWLHPAREVRNTGAKRAGEAGRRLTGIINFAAQSTSQD